MSELYFPEPLATMASKFHLAPLLMITGPEPLNKRAYLKKILCHLDRGIQLIQFRAPHLLKKEYCSLAEKILRESEAYKASVILNCKPHWFKQEAAGLHINSKLLMQLNERPLPSNYLISAACHNEEQLQQAQALGADFVTLSPVQFTNSHPEVSPLGWPLFARLCQSIKIPIYALGGVEISDLSYARTHGAYGIAAIRALWDA